MRQLHQAKLFLTHDEHKKMKGKKQDDDDEYDDKASTSSFGIDE
jgi:hypothetical protein